IRKHAGDRIAELVSKRTGQDEALAALQRDEASLVHDLSGAETRAAECAARLTAANRRLGEIAARSEHAADLMARCEDGHAAATIALNRAGEKKEYLEQIRGEHSRYQQEILGNNGRVKGILADRVRIDKKYRKCFEACLSPLLQALVTESKEDAFACLDELRGAGNGNGNRSGNGNGRGKLQFLYPNGNGNHGAAGPGLSDVALAEDLDEALRIVAADPDTRVATVDGVFFDGPGRIVVAGSDDVEMTLLDFSSKVDELNAAMNGFRRRADRLKERKSSLETLRKSLGQERTALLSEQEAAGGESAAALEERRRLELDLVKTREQIASVAKTRADNDRTIEELRAQLRANSEPADEPDEDAATDEKLSELETSAVRLERDKESLVETAARIRLDIATIAGEIGTAVEKKKNVEMLESELKELIIYRRDDAKRCRFEIEAAKMEISESRENIAAAHAELETIEKEIEQAKEIQEQTSELCMKLEKELKTLKDQRDQKRENIQRCNVEIATRETRISDLIEKARENFNQDLEPLIENRSGFDPVEWEELDLDALEDLRRKIETFGPVNMLALDEFTEKKERFDFLSSQKADLEEARDALTQAIRRINREARRRLSETFERVRANFKTTFLTLFDGGEADLLFVDSDDPLEADIRIVANPKGKRLHDISSLSGGERALVALSLLFAIYLVKPSPFCVFDEVDAPLDDANIGRFIKLLKSFTDKTQFIVITHNKKTMEAADYLYGVTMEEPGVSKSTVSANVTVRFGRPIWEHPPKKKSPFTHRPCSISKRGCRKLGIALCRRSGVCFSVGSG
ncbi:MAG: AAA family ATPase, partial [bacterium]